ncbi:PEP/pyruvate-binding domain-containing protein [Pseudomonas syringae pv. syringae]
MPGKYLTLKTLAQRTLVPTLVGLQESDFKRLWDNYEELQQQSSDLLQAIQLTAGAFLDKHLVQLQLLAPARWRPDAKDYLESRLTGAGINIDQLLAVRSSCSIEDGASHSFAGIFDSWLDVNGWNALFDAIEGVWRSGFSRRAIVERLRCGLLDAPAVMTVIVQHMVAARWAGVAFSHDPLDGSAVPLIEAVAGVGDTLVSGASQALSVRLLGNGDFTGAPQLLAEPMMLSSIAELLSLARQHLHSPADIEWAWDGQQVWLLQARVIASLRNLESSAPVCHWVDLYTAADPDLEPFRPWPDFAQYFRSKRRPLALLARHHGVEAGNALLIAANAVGMTQARSDALLARLHSDLVVLDFSAGIRQQILPRAQLSARLRELLSAQTQVFVVRDFISGDAGLITQSLDNTSYVGQVLCEYSSDGLLAINRGSASTSTWRIDADGLASGHGLSTGTRDLPLTPPQRRQLVIATEAAIAELGEVQLEWVVDRGQLSLVDFSPLKSQFLVNDRAGERTISPGFARGLSLVIDECAQIEEISIAATVSINNLPSPETLGPSIMRLMQRIEQMQAPIVVVSPRPYAALAALIPYVSGFIFESSSLLCHLAILLRESGIPALASPALYRSALSTPSDIVVQANQRPL